MPENAQIQCVILGYVKVFADLLAMVRGKYESDCKVIVCGELGRVAYIQVNKKVNTIGNILARVML